MKYFTQTIFFCIIIITACVSCGGQKMMIKNQTAVINYARELRPQELSDLLKEYRTLIRSINKNEKPVPGIYADYAVLLFRSGDFKNAEKMINLEIKYYPEAKMYLENLIKQ